MQTTSWLRATGERYIQLSFFEIAREGLLLYQFFALGEGFGKGILDGVGTLTEGGAFLFR